MSITCGFFNSSNKDRLYNATHFGHCFDGIIVSGILASIGDCCRVHASTGMTVNVSTGKAWYLSSWLQNDSTLPLTLDVSDVVLDRIDAIVMEFDSSIAVRWNTIKIIKGTPSSKPVRPTLVKNSTKVQIPLAFISVKAKATAITNANIANMVGTSSCPFVTAPLKSINLDDQLGQWEAQLDEFVASETKDFNDEAMSILNSITKELEELEAGTAVELKKRKFTNVNVPISSFVSDKTYSDFPYRAQIALTDVVSTDTPEVILALTEAMSGEFAPVASSYNGGIYIYAASKPKAAITIPTIICWR